MNVYIIDPVDKNINMSVYIKHLNVLFSCSLSLTTSITRTLKILIFGLSQRSSTSIKNILKQTYSLLYFQVILLVKQQASKFLGEEAVNSENKSLSSSHCSFII